MHKLLFIHPDPKLTGLYKTHLSNYFSFDSAFDGLQGLRSIKTGTPDIVVSDYHLDQISGAGLLQFIRQNSKTSRTPFIFLSRTRPNQHALGLGANEWLVIAEINPKILVGKCFEHLKLTPMPI